MLSRCFCFWWLPFTSFTTAGKKNPETGPEFFVGCRVDLWIHVLLQCFAMLRWAESNAKLQHLRRSLTGEDVEGFADLCPEFNIEDMSTDPEVPRHKGQRSCRNCPVKRSSFGVHGNFQHSGRIYLKLCKQMVLSIHFKIQR